MAARSFFEAKPIYQTPTELVANHAPYMESHQRYTTVVVISPEWMRKPKKYKDVKIGDLTSDDRMMAVMHLSSFDTEKECQAYCMKLHKEYGWDLFNIHIVKTNVFVPYPPPEKKITMLYSQERLQQLMTENKRGVNEAIDKMEARMRRDKRHEKEQKAKKGRSTKKIAKELSRKTKAMRRRQEAKRREMAETIREGLAKRGIDAQTSFVDGKEIKKDLAAVKKKEQKEHKEHKSEEKKETGASGKDELPDTMGGIKFSVKNMRTGEKVTRVYGTKRIDIDELEKRLGR